MSDSKLKERLDIASSRFRTLPTVRSLYGEPWFSRELKKAKWDKEGLNAHPLVLLMSIPEPDASYVKQCKEEIRTAIEGYGPGTPTNERFWRSYGLLSFLKRTIGSIMFVKDLESNLSVLSELPKIKGLVKRSKEPQQFDNTLSEIEVNALFRRNGILLEIEPPIGNKFADSKISLCGIDCFVEIVTPQLADVLRKSMGSVVGIRNRLQGYRGIFADKALQLSGDCSGIIILNNGYSEIDTITVDSASHGSYATRLTFDTRTGKCVATESMRESNGLDVIPGGEKVSATIVYKRRYEPDDSLRTNYSIFSRGVRHALSDDQLQELDSAFSKWVFKP